VMANHNVQRSNIICIDYGTFVKPSIKPSVLNSTINAALLAAQETTRLLRQMKFLQIIESYKSVHIIAHSLGANVAAMVALALKHESSRKDEMIGRITGNQK